MNNSPNTFCCCSNVCKAAPRSHSGLNEFSAVCFKFPFNLISQLNDDLLNRLTGCLLGSEIGEFSVYHAEFSDKHSVAYDYFYSDVEPHSKYSPVTLHLSPATRILNENPGLISASTQNSEHRLGARTRILVLFCRST